uniref:Uncharacterized protein n=1 Tax=Oryza brachyantha TaxID=4533 RepID=J3L0M8_ORYBR
MLLQISHKPTLLHITHIRMRPLGAHTSTYPVYLMYANLSTSKSHPKNIHLSYALAPPCN